MTGGTHELTLSTLTYGGEALGRLDDGRAVFVPFGLPGERVRVRLIEDKGQYTRAEMLEVLQAAPERIVARCKHFGVCGGCHYQHLPYERQLTAKAEILRDQLARLGRVENPRVEPTVASPRPWNYRNQAQFHLTPEGRLGYIGARVRPRPDRGIVPIEECHLPETAINRLVPQMDFEGDAALERVSIRAGSGGELLMLLESASPGAPPLAIEAGISVAHMFEQHTLILVGEDHVILRVLGRDFRVSAGAFFQVNTAVAEKMVLHVLSALPAAPQTVIDAYCGVGLFSAFLAPRCERLISVEASPAACEDFGANLDEFQNVELYEDAVERVLPALDAKPNVILVDPPRAGLERAALDSIARMEPEMLMYVSCDPSTLARDAARLIKAGYRLEGVTPFDLFPQTYHIESISLFRR